MLVLATFLPCCLRFRFSCFSRKKKNCMNVVRSFVHAADIKRWEGRREERLPSRGRSSNEQYVLRALGRESVPIAHAMITARSLSLLPRRRIVIKLRSRGFVHLRLRSVIFGARARLTGRRRQSRRTNQFNSARRQRSVFCVPGRVHRTLVNRASCPPTFIVIIA